MIRNVVVHITNEQPLLADLYRMPEPTDVALVCTNVRAMSGGRPSFIHDSAATFIFPLIHIRFVEVPVASRGRGRGATMPDDDTEAAEPGEGGEAGAGEAGDGEAVATPAGARGTQGPKAAPAPPEPEPELEIDEDFLKRVRDI
jgi:hypothetical protein